MYNPTCIITGRKDNLQMFPHRNEKGDMVGWIFLHESKGQQIAQRGR